MNIIDAIVLGAVQGLTEFLPISSSGHLIIAREILGLQVEYGLSFDAVLHFATAFAVLVYFWKDFMGLFKTFTRIILHKPVLLQEKNLLVALIVGTIPAVILGLLLETYMETLFRSAMLVAIILLVGSLIMYAAEQYAKKHTKEQGTAISIKKGLGIGFFQALALIPGMSRSGMTIAGGLFLGLTREEAARFGFLLSLPIVLGAGSKKLLELSEDGVLFDLGFALVFGALAAFVVGMLVIHYLLRYLKSHTLHLFIGYRVLLVAIILLYSFVLM